MTDSLVRGPRASAALRERWSSLGFRSHESIAPLLDRGAERWPGRPAVITATGSTTFRELARRSHHVAGVLIDRGIGPGDVVCWMLPTGPDAIATAAAIWRIGAISSPVVPVYGPHEIAHVVAQVRPAAVVTTGAASRRDHPDEFDAALREAGAGDPVRLLVDGRRPGWTSVDDVTSVPSLSSTLPASRPDDPCLVLFTSGTEAGPKGVLHSMTGLTHELRSTVTEWGLTFRDTMVMASPMTHITGLLQGFLIPARVGAAALLLDRWDPALCVELVERHGATYMAGATPFLRELIGAYEASGRDRSSLVQYCCGGASVPPDLIRQADGLGVAAYRAWGMTELPTATLPQEIDPLWARAETDGRLAPGVELRVVDDEGHDLAPGETGELLVRGPEMMLGYVRDAFDATAFTDDGWLRTGDLGMLPEDGFLRVTGRAKDIINRGGEKLSAREIEEAVAQHPDVEAVAVAAVPGGRLGERVGAVIVSRNADLDLQAVAGAVTSAGLARQKQPELVTLVPTLPTNATGKIDKKAVVALLEQAADPR